MSGQFKKPFPDPQPDPHAVSITERDTVKAPAPPLSGPPQAPLPQAYVQGQHGRYGPRPTGQLPPGPGMRAPARPGPMPPMPPPFGGSSMPPQPDTRVGGPGFQRGPTSGPLGRPGPGTFPLPTSSPAWGNQFVGPRPSGELLPSDKGTKGAQNGKRGKKKRRVPIWARVVLGLLTFLLLLGGSGWWYYQANVAPAVNSITGKKFARARGEVDPNQGKDNSTILNWGRVNILLLGSDTDEKGNWSGNRYLAQTVMVVSIDTNTRDVGILSIPRDFWIPIPGYAYHDKLDTAFGYGGSINNNMSGVGEVVLTLDQDFGILINFYAWVGLNGFVKVIDTVGGVNVDVMHPVTDDNYPDDVGTHGVAAQNALKRLYIPDGPQHLDGPTALEYVRSRHTTSDFNRSARQQQVLGALRLKLSNAGIIGQIPQIAQDLQGSVYTSLSSSQVFDLARFGRGIDSSKIRHLTLSPPYSYNAHIGTQDVVIPRCNLIPDAVNQFLHITTAKCNIGNVGSTGTGASQMASAQTPSAPLAASGQPASAADNTQVGSQLADASQFNPLDAFNDLYGLRGILDLMSLVVLDSPQL